MKVACGGCSSIGCGTCGATATTGLLRWRTWWDRFRSLAESSRLRQIRAHDDDCGIRARGGRAPARGEARGLSGAGLLSHAARGQCAVALGMEWDATRGVHAEWAVCVRAGGYCPYLLASGADAHSIKTNILDRIDKTTVCRCYARDQLAREFEELRQR